MPTHKQITVESDDSGTKGLGKSGDKSTLKAMFASSPIYDGTFTDDSLRESYQDEILDSEINDGGHTFGLFDPSYADSHDPSTVETGPAGLPASPYVPNPASPGPGSVSPLDLPEPPDGFGQTPGNPPFNGVGSKLSPKDSSKKISFQKIGDYLFGKSSKGT